MAVAVILRIRYCTATDTKIRDSAGVFGDSAHLNIKQLLNSIFLMLDDHTAPAQAAPLGRRSFSSRVLIASILLHTLMPTASAQTFSALLERAVVGDPTFLGARTGVDVADARKRQAVGALLPQVSATANTNSNNRDYQTRSTTTPPAQDSYNSHGSQLTLTQPLWRYANIVGWQQAGAIAAQAEHQLAGAEQDLFVRLMSAWFDVLAARDVVLFTMQQMTAAERNFETVHRGEELGTHSTPQLEEAKAKSDQAIADALTAETELQLKVAALEQIVGALRGFVPLFMRDDAVLADPGPEKMDVWLERVETQNPNVLAASKALEAASDEVRKQWAGHQPTIDIVANYGKNSQAVGGFPGQAGYDIKTGAVGLQLNVPIFSGGAQSAKVDEALAQKEKARHELEAARRNAILAGKQAWLGWQSARMRAQAGAQTLRSAEAGLDAARQGLGKGLKAELDVMQAEQAWRAAIKDYRKARYDQMVSYAKLKAATGILTQGDIQALDALFINREALPPARNPKNDNSGERAT